MYSQAGCGPEDLDFAQLYDDYPVMAFIQLEGLGVTEPGETAEFIRTRDVTVRGRFPSQHRRRPAQRRSGRRERRDDSVSTKRSRSCGGDAGDRQVECRRGVVSGLRHGGIRPRPVLQRRGPGQGLRTAPMTPKPNPRKTPISAPFWEGCNDGPPDAAAVHRRGLRALRLLSPRLLPALRLRRPRLGGSVGQGARGQLDRGAQAPPCRIRAGSTLRVPGRHAGRRTVDVQPPRRDAVGGPGRPIGPPRCSSNTVRARRCRSSRSTTAELPLRHDGAGDRRP